MNRVTDPTPAPPLDGRGEPTEFQAASKAAAAPLPSRGGVGGGVCIFIILSYSLSITKSCAKLVYFFHNAATFRAFFKKFVF